MKPSIAPSRDEDLDDPVVYPDSDGEPMGETGWHVRAIMFLYMALEHCLKVLRGRKDVYVAADMFLYYEKGNVQAQKAPDVMVILGVDGHERASWKTWKENAVPQVVFEITSEKTWKQDHESKPAVYARLGVKEYFLFDPLDEYLEHPLIGFRLVNKRYKPMPVAEDGSLASEVLQIRLQPEKDLLRVFDLQTDQEIPFATEYAPMVEHQAERARQEGKRARREEKRAQREAERAAAAEQEVARLKALLAELKKEPK